MAKENSAPVRVLAGQKTLLSRAMHDIHHDPVHDEIVVGNSFAQAVLTFRGDADGEQAPVRAIQGRRTQIIDPQHVDVDPIHNEIYVPNRSSVLVFPREATGDTPPIRVIQGPDTTIKIAYGIAVDPIHNLLIVGDRRSGGLQESGMRESPSQGTLAIFNRTDSGNVKPLRVIGGPHSGISTINQMTVIPSTGWILLCTYQGEAIHARNARVAIWSEQDNGDVPARWSLAGPKSTLQKPRGVAFDSKHKELIVADMRLNAVFSFYFPEIF